MVKSKFMQQFQPHDRVLQTPGSGDRQLYTSELQDNGEIALIPSGVEDLYASIQSHKDSCDIHVLLARYQNGDIEALSQRQGVYGDFTEMPKTYMELLNTVISGRSYFDSLPVETREKFDHSFEKFMMSMDNMEQFAKLMGFDDSKSAPDVPSEKNKENEPSPVPVAKEAANE